MPSNQVRRLQRSLRQIFHGERQHTDVAHPGRCSRELWVRPTTGTTEGRGTVQGLFSWGDNSQSSCHFSAGRRVPTSADCSCPFVAHSGAAQRCARRGKGSAILALLWVGLELGLVV